MAPVRNPCPLAGSVNSNTRSAVASDGKKDKLLSCCYGNGAKQHGHNQDADRGEWGESRKEFFPIQCVVRFHIGCLSVFPVFSIPGFSLLHHLAGL